MIHFEMMYAADTVARRIASVALGKDGVCLREYKPMLSYGRDWRVVSSLTTCGAFFICCAFIWCGRNLLVTVSRMIGIEDNRCGVPYAVAPHEGGLIISDPDNHRLLKWWRHDWRLEVFAGDRLSGNCEGIASKCRFYQPTGICTEFDNVVYVCNTQTSCIKMMTNLNNTARFLKGIGALYSAFSIHEKHDTYTLCNLSESISKVGNCLSVFEENAQSTEPWTVCCFRP